MTDTFRFALIFGLLFCLILIIYRAGWAQGRWYERREQSRQRRLARHDQDRWDTATICGFSSARRK
jgi:hypothetical protein